MRQDARNLLERLNNAGFRYKEFPDSFADMELWPIFEAILRDEQVVGTQASTLPTADIQVRRAMERETRSAMPSAKVSLFQQYATEPVAPPPAAPVEEVLNVRQYFSRFSEER